MSSEASGSRSRRSSSASSSSSSSTPFEDPPIELVDEYHQLLRQRFDEFQAASSLGTLLLPAHPILDNDADGNNEHVDGRAMTKAEKQNAKKKRRKERERLAKQQQGGAGGVDGALLQVQAPSRAAVEFRLFSSCPVRPVSIVPPSEDYPVPPNPRHQGFTVDDQARLRRRAEAAAIAFDPSGPSSSTWSFAPRWTRTDRPVKLMRPSASTGSDDLPNIFIGTVPNQHRGVAKTRPIELSLQPLTADVSKRTRRGKRKRGSDGTKHRPNPAYWTPAAGQHVGGKSMSTVWGYGLGMAVR